MLNKLFGKKKDKAASETKNKINVEWIPLTSVGQLKEVTVASKEGYAGIFKHSTRCSISRSVAKRFEQNYPADLTNLKMYYLDLLNYREISNEITAQFQVMHQSPQFILIKNGKAILNASHYDIAQIDLPNIIK